MRRTYAAKTVWLALLCLILAVCAPIFTSSLASLRLANSWLRPFDETIAQAVREGQENGPMARQNTAEIWVWRLSDPAPPERREVTVTVRPTGVALDLTIWLASGSASLEFRGPTGLNSDLTAFVEAAFGEITVYGLPISEGSFTGLEWRPDPGRDAGSFHITAEFLAPGWVLRDGRALTSVSVFPSARPQFGSQRAERAFVTPLEDEITFVLDGLQLRSLQPAPTKLDAVTDGAITLRRSTTGPQARISLAAGPEVLPELISLPSARPPQTRRDVLRQLGALSGGSSHLSYFATSLIRTVVSVVPLLVFLALVARMPRDASSPTRHLATAVTGLLLFHFTLDGTRLIGHALDALVRGAYPLGNELWVSAKDDGLMVGMPSAEQAWRFLSIGILGLLVPDALRHWMRPGGPGSRWARLVWLTLAEATVLVIAYASATLPGTFEALVATLPWVPAALAAALSGTLVWWALATAYWLLVGRPSPILALSLAVLLTGLLGIAAPHRALKDEVILVVSLCLSAWLLLAMATLTVSTLNCMGVRVIITRLQWAALIAVVLALVTPSSGILFALGTDALQVFAYRLSLVTPYIWVGGVVWLCYLHGRGTLAIDARTRAIGLLAASTLIFGTGSTLFSLATFLAGWLLLSKLVRPATYWSELEPVIDRVVRGRVHLLDQILDVNAADRAFRALRKRLTGKLTDGEIDFQTYDRQLFQRESHLDRLRRDTDVSGRSIRDVALTFGPYSTAWRNAIHGASWSLVFAIPWIGIVLMNRLAGQATGFEYPLFDLLSDLLIVLSRWAVFGFTFGYFYPYILGRNGLEKGLALFMVAVVPTIPIAGLTNTTQEAWEASLFLMLQVFLQCMLLGIVAFDYVTLRQGRHDWRMVFEVHGLTAVGVSLSSIVVAVGTTITALLTSRATDLAKLALELLLPDLPTTPPTGM